MKNLNNYEVMYITDWKYSKQLKDQQSFNFIISWLWKLINIPNFLSILYKKLNFKYSLFKKYNIRNVHFHKSEYPIELFKKYNTIFGEIIDGDENYIVSIPWLKYIPVEIEWLNWYKKYEMKENEKWKAILLIINSGNLLLMKHLLDIIYSKQKEYSPREKFYPVKTKKPQTFLIDEVEDFM